MTGGLSPTRFPLQRLLTEWRTNVPRWQLPQGRHPETKHPHRGLREEPGQVQNEPGRDGAPWAQSWPLTVGLVYYGGGG